MIGDTEYKAAVSKELDRLAESLYLVHHGDASYMNWLLENNPAVHKGLSEFPAGIHAAIGILPFKAIVAMISFCLASHTLIYEAWSCQEQVGLEVLIRLVSSTSAWKM